MFVLAMFACTPAASDSGSEFEGGDFQFTTTAVADGCNDGAFDTIFMPEGENQPQDFEKPIELPSTSDLPKTYTVDIQDPFTAMEVTVTAGEETGQMVVTGAKQKDVVWDADTYPDCLVDASIDIWIEVVNDNKVQGYAALGMTSFEAEVCPTVKADPCDIRLDLTAQRI